MRMKEYILVRNKSEDEYEFVRRLLDDSGHVDDIKYATVFNTYSEASGERIDDEYLGELKRDENGHITGFKKV